MEIGNLTRPVQHLKPGKRSVTGLGSGHWNVRLVLAAVLAVFAVGCGESNPSRRLPVSGTVTWNGQPLKTGRVLFLPVGEGRSASANVVDGAFELPAKIGVPVGTYEVRITSEQPTGKTYSDPELPGVLMDVTKQVLPARYNSKTELTLVVKGPPVTALFELSDK